MDNITENEKRTFEELELSDRIIRAINDMGFVSPTTIQEKAIPLIRQGLDVIGRSQTGTGKTMAFAIPAIEIINSLTDKSYPAVIIMLPTRELAMQCCNEIKKLTKYCEGIRPVEVYGGAPIEKQITKLKRANIVIGTPGRIMDHLRRRTLKLDRIRLAVLDEADEMLSMGFKEDMETILRETPENRQTVLFSATMPPAILSITEEFQKTPELIEASGKKITLDNIIQTYINVPMGRKLDALKLLLYYHSPSLSMVFCNTKKMSEEVALSLSKDGINAELLHGDLKQSQRTTVMEKFRSGAASVLVATDVAARGIDVSDVEFVFNYDIPQNNEYYVHRIGRTGRIGKKGNAVTICSGRRQEAELLDIVHRLNSSIEQTDIPTGDDINYRIAEGNLSEVGKILEGNISDRYKNMVNMLLSQGHSLFDIAAASLQLHFSDKEIKINDIQSEKKQRSKNGTSRDYSKIILNIGRASRVAPNHLVASITERSLLHGSDIGKIEIFDDNSIVAIPSEHTEEVIDSMFGAKVCGKPVKVSLYEERKPAKKEKTDKDKYSRKKPMSKKHENIKKQKHGAKRHR